MKDTLTKEQIRELEEQLSCPKGEFGVELGENMNQSNIGMTLNTIDFLEFERENTVLELGHGNCGHLEKLLSSAEGINYYGLEISETMMNEATKNNLSQKAEFNLYNGESIPYSDNYFDKIFSVNTIYFWSNPEGLIHEIERTLKPSGICVLSYANKEFMKNLPFVGEKFTLFDQEDIKKLVEKSNLRIIAFKELMEEVKSKMGEQVERKFTMVKLEKTAG